MEKSFQTNADVGRPFALKNRLHGFKMQFEACKQSGIQLDAEGVDLMLVELRAMEDMATEMGNELHAFRYEYQREQDNREQIKAVMRSVNDRHGNVVLFPASELKFGG